jgi:hypothetical protein
MNLENDFGLAEVLAILALLVGVGYIVWDYFQNGDAGITDDAGQTSSVLGAFRGTNSVDPVTGGSNGLVNSFDALVFGSNNGSVGGGEVAGTSETYTGALSEMFSNPGGVLKSIF